MNTNCLDSLRPAAVFCTAAIAALIIGAPVHAQSNASDQQVREAPQTQVDGNGTTGGKNASDQQGQVAPQCPSPNLDPETNERLRECFLTNSWRVCCPELGVVVHNASPPDLESELRGFWAIRALWTRGPTDPVF